MKSFSGSTQQTWNLTLPLLTVGILVWKAFFTPNRGTRLLCTPSIMRVLLTMIRSTTGALGVISLLCPGKTAVTRLLLGVARWELMRREEILLMASCVVLIRSWVEVWLLSRVLLMVTRHRLQVVCLVVRVVPHTVLILLCCREAMISLPQSAITCRQAAPVRVRLSRAPP